MISVVWTGMMIISLFFSLFNGTAQYLSAAITDGAASAVQLSLTLAATVCLWSGVIEVMRRCGISKKLSASMFPVIKVLFPTAAKNQDIVNSISENITSNILGLGGAATASGLAACKLMKDESCNDDLLIFITLNTMSIQLIPTTIAAIRSSAGSTTPFDIIPAALITSACALAAGLLSAFLFRRITK